jgi:AAA family ATP:ADP antiporter
MKHIKNKVSNSIQTLALVKPHEISALLMSWLYFFLLLSAYYLFRPIRNDMLVQNGIANLQWLLLGAMVAMLIITPLFGWLTSRIPIRYFLVACTLFFASNLVCFYLVFNDQSQPLWLVRTFYIWANVFALFAVSLFWSFMNDLFNAEQSKRLFALISAGGTAGALAGPLVTTLLIDQIGVATLLVVAAILLTLTTPLIWRLSTWKQTQAYLTPQQTPLEGQSAPPVLANEKNATLKGSAWGGVLEIIKSRYLVAICVFILLFTFIATYIALGQLSYIEQAFPNPQQRTKLFSQIDLAVSVLTLLFQLFLTSRLINLIGYRWTLSLVPISLSLGVLFLAFMPAFWALIALQIVRRSGEYAIMKPSREMLFTVLPRAQKYKAKNFIDTVIFRTGDTISAAIYNGIKSITNSTQALTVVGIAAALTWCYTSFYLGKRYVDKQDSVDQHDNHKA